MPWQSLHSGYTDNRRVAEVGPIKKREERNVWIMEIFTRIFQNVAGTISALERSDNISDSFIDMIGNIRKSDWFSAAVFASSIIAYILYL